jgi:predicted phage terminase large subunit-like protein
MSLSSGYDILIRKVVENGKPIFPEAFCLTDADRDILRAEGKKVESIQTLKRTQKGKFWGQYLNDPMDDSQLEFKREYFQTFTIEPGSQLASEFFFAPVLISVDPAFRLGQANDDTGIVVTKTLSDNNIYILEAKGIKVSPTQLIQEIFRLVDKYQFVSKVLLETVTSQIMLMDLLQAEMRKTGKFFIIQEVKPESNQNKPARIRGLIPHYANRRIFHMPGLHQLEDQLLEFPKGTHDDIIDSLAYQVKFWQPFEFGKTPHQEIEGSYSWWRKKARKRPTVIGKLFTDIR